MLPLACALVLASAKAAAPPAGTTAFNVFAYQVALEIDRDRQLIVDQGAGADEHATSAISTSVRATPESIPRRSRQPAGRRYLNAWTQSLCRKPGEHHRMHSASTA